jgi:hypothetical protein
MQAQIFSGADVPDPTRDAEHQLDLVRSAIALLASGGALRVTLVNLALSEGTVREANALARASGMLLRIAVHGIGSDITVEASA